MQLRLRTTRLDGHQFVTSDLTWHILAEHVVRCLLTRGLFQC